MTLETWGDTAAITYDRAVWRSRRILRWLAR